MTNNEGIPELAFDAVNVSDPGAIPYIEFSANNFGEILSLTESMTEQSWVVSTPAGPLVVGYKQIKSILRNPDWISLLSSFSALEQTENGISDLNVMLEQAQRIVPEIPSTVRMRPNVLSVEGDDHKRLRRLVNSSFTSGNTSKHRRFMKDHADSLVACIYENGGGELVT